MLPVAGLERAYPWRKTRGSIINFGFQMVLGLGALVVGIYFIREGGFQTLLYLAIFAGLFYYGLTGLFNTTTVRLEGDQLVVYTGPFLWPNKKSLPVSEIRALQVRKTKSRYTYIYHLTAQMANNRKIDLLSSFTSSAPLDELAGELKNYLGVAVAP